ncbi:type 2 lanthipeptide synthetase LanM family protein [Haloferax mediterranei]|uniref:type 2 lanthipeptide synthetase LanM family protein n=1 Tax=Haloferax mediterranei TaxID=2252 RepID=UPI001FCF0AA0|nr:type 2 lanthipeptide synthetase LanM family protein [Haloferax mediterranei]
MNRVYTMGTVLTESERHEIAGRARTLAERLDGPANSAGSPPPIDPTEIFDEWKHLFPDDESFRARLAHDGFTETAVREQIAATHWPETEPLPDWVDTLSDLVQHVGTCTKITRKSVSTPDQTPFGELLTAIASFACDQLSQTVVSMAAVSSMERQLVDRLRSLCVRVLYVEFKSFVEVHDPELAATNPAAVSEPSTEYYEQFIEAMLGQGFKNLCLEYPVLARQLTTLLDNWQSAVEELCRRLQTDREALRQRFGIEGSVTDLNPLTTDTHAGGRVPVQVSFEDGSVVYKPRPLDGEVTFYTILNRLDEYLPTPRFETPSLLPRDGYGWMELVEYRDLPDESAADRYYERAGSLLCLAYVLNFTDCHYENLLVDGATPTVVDGETIFHPHVESDAKPFETEASAAVDRSVLLSVMLPFSVGDPREAHGRRFADKVAGLGSDSEETALPNQSRPTIEAVNTDVMAVDMEAVTVDPYTNTPSVSGVDHPPSDHVDALVGGFEEAYETIHELHETGRFLNDVADPELVAGGNTRLLYRSTGRYASILRSAAARNSLRDGARLTVEYERLAVPFFDGTVETDRLWSLYDSERRALRDLDIPRFASRTDQRALFYRDEQLDVVADKTGYEFVRQRLDGMSETDRRRQTWLIRQALGESMTAGCTPRS